jgi:hypothetical protein
MEKFDEDQKILMDIITKDFVNRISYSKRENLGVFQALQIICKKVNLWELEMILFVAEREPIRNDTLVNHFADKVSKSTIYRKIAHYVEREIFRKQEDGNIRLSSQLESIGIIAKLHNSLQSHKSMNKP